MAFHFNSANNLNEILFAGKNKNYGAYMIRSSYDSTVFKSLGIVGSTVLFFFGAVYFWNRSKPDEIHHPICQVVPYDVTPFAEQKKQDPDPNGPAKKSHALTASAKQEQTESQVIRKDTNNVDEPQLNSQQTSSVQNTDPLSNPGSENAGENGGSAEGPASEKPGSAFGSEPQQGMTDPDQLPEFEGGYAAISRFIASNLIYPELAKAVGKQGKIGISFVVDEEGRVTSVKKINTLGYGLDEEAIRVISRIPRFKSPGMFQGRKVKVQMTVPINFSIH
jgi:protein TonB